jgi:hypothetical protein
LLILNLRLNPYDLKYVPNPLKVEYPQYPDLQCYAVSAKHVLSHSAGQSNPDRQGIGKRTRSDHRSFGKRIDIQAGSLHLAIDSDGAYRGQSDATPSCESIDRFRCTLATQISGRPAGDLGTATKTFNKDRNFDMRVKPFGFVQTIVPDRDDGSIPMAPFEKDVHKSMRLPWVDFKTGKPVRLDWHSTAMAGTIGVMRLQDYINEYQVHAESKAADAFGNPANKDTPAEHRGG